jgi:hypothetical protein
VWEGGVRVWVGGVRVWVGGVPVLVGGSCCCKFHENGKQEKKFEEFTHACTVYNFLL